MKNLSKVLALVLVVAMVFSMAVSAGAAASFKDSASVNYTEAVQLLAALDVISGYDTDGDGKGDTFKPGENITRAELAVMISYIVANSNSEFGLYSDITKLNADYKSLCTFADSKAHWAAGFIAYCYGNKYISGRDANTFDPEGNVTVAEAAVILLRVMGYNAEIEAYGTTAGTVGGYNTQLDARNAGLLNGMENVNFFAAATREQVAQLVLNALDNEVVTYNALYGFSLIANNALVVTGTTAYQTGHDLVEYCFKNVKKLTENVYDAYGFAGHQWVAYNANGSYVPLTDVVRDEQVLVSFLGGTSYGKVASTLGITSATSTVPSVVYVNGKLVTGATGSLATYASVLPGNGDLNSIYAAAYDRDNTNDYLPENCTLSIVREYDRSVAGTTYKLMYNFEFVATISAPVLINVPTSQYYGLYEYTVSYWNSFDYDNNPATDAVEADFVDYVYSTSNAAYNKDAYYLVVPNESGLPNGTNGLASNAYPNKVNYNAFLSITEAKTVASFTADRLSALSFKAMERYGGYIYSGTTAYAVSGKAHDFIDTPALGTAMGLVLNSAGYVVGYTPLYSYNNNVAGVGYLYVDAVEFSATLNAYADLVNQLTYSWYTQGKALVYFPTAQGNATPTVITLNANKAGTEINIGCANYDAIDVIDAYVGATKVTLTKNAETLAAYENGNGVQSYPTNSNDSTIRVYNTWFDGWYAYTQYTDGSYKLVPVGKDYATVAANNPNVAVNGTANAALLTSTSVANTYTMDLATKTATVVSAAVAPGNYGYNAATIDQVFNGTTMVNSSCPVTGKNIGGEIEYVTKTNKIAVISQFNTNRVVNYDYVLYQGVAGSYLVNGAVETGYKFYVNGKTEVLFLADTIFTENCALDGDGRGNPATSAQTVTWLDNNKTANAWTLTLTNGVVTGVKSHAMVTDKTVADVDAQFSWIKISGEATGTTYVASNVWNSVAGTDTPAKNATVDYVVHGGKIVAMWVTAGAGATNPDHVPGGNQWWN